MPGPCCSEEVQCERGGGRAVLRARVYPPRAVNLAGTSLLDPRSLRKGGLGHLVQRPGQKNPWASQTCYQVDWRLHSLIDGAAFYMRWQTPQPQGPSYSQGVDNHPLVSGRWWHQAPGRLAFALQTPSSPPLEPGFGRGGAHGGLGAGWGWAVGGWAVPRD